MLLIRFGKEPPARAAGRRVGRRRSWTAGAVAAASAAALCSLAPAAQATVPHRAAAVTAVPTVVPITAPSAASVTLPTGEKVTVTTSAGSTRSTYAIEQGAAPVSGQFSTYQGADGDHFLIPSEAEPYLGRQLSPALFDAVKGYDEPTGNGSPNGTAEF